VIDTVEFRVHDLTKHLRVAQWLDRQITRTGKTVCIVEGEEQWTVEQKVNFRTKLKYHDTGNEHTVAHFNELRSDHYNIAYKIDYIRGFIAFNVSIPKYIYGTNILLYNRPPSDKNFNYAAHSTIEKNLREAYKRLFKFFNRFFPTQFGEIAIDWKDVEINRIDICYNQMFDSKESAFDYLNHLRKLKKKYARNSTNYSRDWKTSIVYKTERYSFKVYHKGTEFAKNDAKKLRELNEAGKGRFDIDYYQRFADKILRYEMTFRNSQISYLFMNHLFRSECYIWQAGVKLWKTAKAKKADKANYMAYRAGLEKHEKHAIDYVNSMINKTKKFYLEDNSASKRFDEETNECKFLATPFKKETFNPASLFSPELFDLITKQFCTLLEEFKLGMHQNSHDVLSRLKFHNEAIDKKREQLERLKVPPGDKLYRGVGRKISESKIKMLLRLLETETFEEIQESNYFEAKTWYNHRKDLSILGVTQNAQLSLVNRADMDLRQYNSELTFNSYKFKYLDR
jgi:hypothetical protein